MTISRRTFLGGAAAAGVPVAAGCSDEGSGPPSVTARPRPDGGAGRSGHRIATAIGPPPG